jgi:predicted lipid-binding transport protein (Tim44 family)
MKSRRVFASAENFARKGWEHMKFHWSPNMMTFVGALILGLVVSLAFVAAVKGQGGGAFAFIAISMIGTGMVVAGLLMNHDAAVNNHQQMAQQQGQMQPSQSRGTLG